jgi:hypothetical protein
VALVDGARLAQRTASRVSIRALCLVQPVWLAGQAGGPLLDIPRREAGT